MENDTPTIVSEVTKENPQGESDNTLLMSILAYVGILVLIPLLIEKNNSVVKFHVKQGLVLFAIEMVAWAGTSMMWVALFTPLFMMIQLGTLVLSIIGIINAAQKKQVELPLVGTYAKYFTF